METAQQLADTTIEVVPALTQTIAPDGGITFEAADRVEMSLLQVGLNPTRGAVSGRCLGPYPVPIDQ